MQQTVRWSVWFSVILVAAFVVGYMAWAKSTSAWPYDNETFPYPERAERKN